MDSIRTFVRRLMEVNPVLVISTVSGILLILANFGIAPAINVDAAVLTAFNTLAIVATVLGVRESVYSPKTTQALADRAEATGNTDIGDPPTGAA